MTAQEADALLSSVTDLGRRVFAAAACSLALLEPDDEHLVFRAASGAGAAEVVGMRLPVSRGIAGWVVSSGQPIAIHDVRADARFARDVAESTGYVPRSILAAPLQLAGEVFGVVEVLDRDGSMGHADMDLLKSLATHAALAVELARGVPAQPDGAAAGHPADVLAEVARLGAEEQRAVAAMLTGFLSYVERRGGPAGLV